MKEPGEVFTPKEYAKWLVDQMLLEHDVPYYIATESALKSINVAIDSIRLLVSHYVKSNGVKAYMDIQFSKDLTLTYFREVKKEIEKL